MGPLYRHPSSNLTALWRANSFTSTRHCRHSPGTAPPTRTIQVAANWAHVQTGTKSLVISRTRGLPGVRVAASTRCRNRGLAPNCQGTLKSGLFRIKTLEGLPLVRKRSKQCVEKRVTLTCLDWGKKPRLQSVASANTEERPIVLYPPFYPRIEKIRQ